MKNRISLLMVEALDYEAEAFDKDEAVNAADLVDWFAAWRERAKAVVRTEALPTGVAACADVESEEPTRYRNRYRHCGQDWGDTWSCACNDKCPVCNAEIEPFESERILEAEG